MNEVRRAHCIIFIFFVPERTVFTKKYCVSLKGEIDMIKGFNVTFNVVDAHNGELINQTTFKSFFKNERVVVAENTAEAEELAIVLLREYLKEKGHVVRHICKPYKGLLVDGDVRWCDFRVVKLPET